MRYLKPLVALILVSWVGSEYLIEQQAVQYEHHAADRSVRRLLASPASGEADTLEIDTAAKPVFLYRELPKPAGKMKTALYHPKSEAERLRIIAKVWGLEGGNYEIGSAR